MMQHASIVIPVKGLASGKSRLAVMLSSAERLALNRRLVEHVLETALEAARIMGADIAVYLLSPDESIADIASSRSARFIHQTTEGLNAGLFEAVDYLPAHRTVFLAADLPNLTSDDITPLLNAPGIGLAPDRRQIGTNALSVPQPGSLPFSFGPVSMRLHLEAAEQLGLPVQLIQRPGLALDIDTKDDLERINGWP
jgi:2-phospho-L-lactate guanylyltransferase